MGLFSSLGKTIGTIAGIAAPAISHAGVAGVASALGQYAFNQQKIDLANTSHRREVEDLKKAGLNPILSATKGGQGAAVPDIQNPGITGMSTKTAAKQLSLQEKSIQSQIDLNNSTAQKQEYERQVLEQQVFTEKTKQRYNEALSILTENQAEKVKKETDSILPLMREKLQAEIDKIGDERERIRIQNQLDEATTWQIYEMTYVAKAQLEINKQNADSNRISANAAATSANAAAKDAKGREDSGYYKAQADAARSQSDKNLTSALGDLAQVVGFVVSKGRF